MWLVHNRPDELATTLERCHGLRWVQFTSAGVDPFRHLLTRDLVWTSGKGVTASSVAELAVALLLAGRRGLVRFARSGPGSDRRTLPLAGARVAVIGGGAIGSAVVLLLNALDAEVTVVRRSGPAVDGARRTVRPDQLDEAITDVAGVVLALPLTEETTGMITGRELQLMGTDAWLVNVARGQHVRTDDLVEALRDGVIAGAALDVTDPEPLPAGHPLLSMSNCLITPHVGFNPGWAAEAVAERIEANLRRFLVGAPLLGLVDPERRY